MTNIRVDIPLLRAQAQQMSEAAAELSAIASRLLSATANAPSYDGQFGPRVAALGPEAHAHLQQLATELAEEAEQLRAKADAFDAADQQARANLLGLLGQMDALLMGFPLLSAYLRRKALAAVDAERSLRAGNLIISPRNKSWWELVWGGMSSLIGLGLATNLSHPPSAETATKPPTVTVIFHDPGPAGAPAAPTRASREGVEFIARFEGVRLELYNDPAGHCTIGVGHLVHLGPCDGQDSESPFANGITEQEAYDLFAKDVADAEQAVTDLVKVPLTQAQYDALVSFTFNLSRYNLATSDLLVRLNAGEYDAVPDELNRWVYDSPTTISPGLQIRRKQEGELFSTGVYGAGP